MLDPLSVVIQQEVGTWDCPCCLVLVSWLSGPDAYASSLEGRSPYHTVVQGQLWPLQSPQAFTGSGGGRRQMPGGVGAHHLLMLFKLSAPTGPSYLGAPGWQEGLS